MKPKERDAGTIGGADEEPAEGGKPKQGELAGFQSVKMQAVENAIESYCEARDERMAAGEIEVNKKAKLIEVLKKHGLDRYKRGPFSATLKAEQKVKARVKEDDGKDHSGADPEPEPKE